MRRDDRRPWSPDVGRLAEGQALDTIPIAGVEPAAQSNQLYPKCRDGPSRGRRSACGTPDTILCIISR